MQLVKQALYLQAATLSKGVNASITLFMQVEVKTDILVRQRGQKKAKFLNGSLKLECQVKLFEDKKFVET